MNKLFRTFRSLGPGLLFAGAAIGVSHLVQSTRAGADYGMGLIWALLLVHLFKYPFFQYGPRYAAATGESLIDGYKRLGKGFLWMYYILTFATMFTIQAAVTIVTAGLAIKLFGFTGSTLIWSAVITLISMLVLLIGKYKLLDNLMKIIVVVLSISSLIALGIAYNKTAYNFDFTPIFPQGKLGIAFLIAFMGWMPAPLDISAWHSLWTLEKSKTENITPKKAIFDFNIGYLGTVVLGLCFLALGALVMHNSGETFSNSAGKFSGQLINLYTKNLGQGTYIIIAVAAFTTMFSTTITTLDASPRAMAKTTSLLFEKATKNTYFIWMIFLGAGTLIILNYFITSMAVMIKVATIISFLTAPFYAIANYLLITSKHTPVSAHPSSGLKVLSWLGILFLIGFSLFYLLSL
ncbi:MAG: Nramp family divalent metal transporter [Flavobacteriales bacterium]|jgi:Mn2+/Fe2+ NRAMP family transporter|nr:Nramp family divalent metal transporter [Flavobacteriales bacterium]